MLDTIKKCIFYFNAAALSFSYFLISLWFSIFALQNAPYSLINFLTTLKPVDFILEFINDIMYEFWGGILFLTALFLPIIVSILTYIFLRKELSKRTTLLLSFSFVLPLGIFTTFLINDTILDGYKVLSYISFGILALLFLSYGITTLSFMHRDNDELDW